jgi:hypothetical protein
MWVQNLSYSPPRAASPPLSRPFLTPQDPARQRGESPGGKSANETAVTSEDSEGQGDGDEENQDESRPGPSPADSPELEGGCRVLLDQKPAREWETKSVPRCLALFDIPPCVTRVRRSEVFTHVVGGDKVMLVNGSYVLSLERKEEGRALVGIYLGNLQVRW